MVGTVQLVSSGIVVAPVKYPLLRLHCPVWQEDHKGAYTPHIERVSAWNWWQEDHKGAYTPHIERVSAIHVHGGNRAIGC